MTSNRIFSAIFFTVLTSLPLSFAYSEDYHAEADYQGTEAALLTPWPVFENSIRSFAGPRKKFEQNLPNSVWNFGQFQFNLTNLRWSVSSEFETSKLLQEHLDLISRNLHIEVQVDRVTIDQYIEQVVDGIPVRVRIQADCGNIRLQQNQAEASGRLVFQFNPQNIVTRLENFAMQWNPNSWQVSTITCQGTRGFEQLLQNELNTRLATAEEIRPWVQDLLKEKIQQEVDATVEKLKSPTALPLPKGAAPVKMTFLNFESRPEGVVTRAKMTWGSSNSRVRSFEVTGWPKSAPTEQPTMLLPQLGLSDYIRASVNARSEWDRIDLREVSGFMRVLKSRFLQFFLWPDLWNYKKSDPFYLSIGRPKTFDLSWTDKGTLRVSTTMDGWVQSRRKDQWWNYVLVRGSASGTLDPKIENGRFQIDLDLNNTKIQTGMGKEYVERFKPNKYLANSVLNSFVEQLGENLNFSFAIPKLDLGPVGTARPVSWKNNGGVITIPFAIQN